MELKITTPEAYRRALDRINELRAGGATASTDTKLAELEGAIAAYETKPNEPDESKGKPTPDPYDKK